MNEKIYPKYEDLCVPVSLKRNLGKWSRLQTWQIIVIHCPKTNPYHIFSLFNACIHFNDYPDPFNHKKYAHSLFYLGSLSCSTTVPCLLHMNVIGLFPNELHSSILLSPLRVVRTRNFDWNCGAPGKSRRNFRNAGAYTDYAASFRQSYSINAVFNSARCIFVLFLLEQSNIPVEYATAFHTSRVNLN